MTNDQFNNGLSLILLTLLTILGAPIFNDLEEISNLSKTDSYTLKKINKIEVESQAMRLQKNINNKQYEVISKNIIKCTDSIIYLTKEIKVLKAKILVEVYKGGKVTQEMEELKKKEEELNEMLSRKIKKNEENKDTLTNYASKLSAMRAILEKRMSQKDSLNLKLNLLKNRCK